MTFSSSLRLRATGALIPLTLLLAACGNGGDGNNNSPTLSPDAQESTPIPTTSVAKEDQGFTTLPIYLAATFEYMQEHPGEDRSTLACGEELVLVNTVPVKTDDPVATALEFLFENEQFYHGDPSLMDPLKNSTEAEISEITISDDEVSVALTGGLFTRGGCESAQIVAMLERTAKANAGVENAVVTVDGTPIRDYFGMATPYAAGEEPAP